MPALAYPLINKAESEIRVLTLHAGSLGDPIVCSLDTVSLSEPVEYEALSYAWGPAILSKEIVVNGATISITESAFAALVHLRLAETVRQVWIDAICINQLDDGERNHQVKLMKDIYQRASCVLVWLGPALGDSDLGLDLLEELCNKTTLATSEGKAVPTQNLQDLPILPLRELIRILHRPYWNRVWVIQETAVASLDPLIGCGQRWLSWHTWKLGLIQIYAYHRGGTNGFVTDGIDLDHEMIIDNLAFCSPFFDLDHIRSITGHESGGVQTCNVQDILWYSMGRESLDPRDRVYAVLGLIRSPDTLNPLEVIEVDYTKRLRQVYCEVVNLALKSGPDLNILFFRNHLRDPDFPSWLPDFSATTNTYPPLIEPRASIWNASKPTRPPPPLKPYLSPVLSNDLCTLIVSGKLVDRIDKVLELQGIWTDPRAVFHQIRRFALPNRQNKEEGASLFYVEEALWRTLLGDRSLLRDMPCPGAYRHAFAELLYEDVPLPERRVNSTQVNDFISAAREAISFSSHMPHRRLFVTKTGRFGLGPPDCETGDIVSLLWLYPKPVVLRPHQTFYEFVGDGYVHGMMQGEEALVYSQDHDFARLELR